MVLVLLSGCSLFAPKYVENKLKFFPFIKEAVALGDRREMVGAFINIEMEAVGNWAERRGLGYSGYVDLAGQDAVYNLIRECVEKVNADLAQEERLADSQIRRFLILHKELDADDGELTRTRKVRRSVINEKYADVIDSIYSGETEIKVDTVIRFQDGTTQRIRTTMKVVDMLAGAMREAAE